jgi:lipopolysaccharide export system protein LptA
MFYKFSLLFLFIFSFNELLEAQEYSITSEKIEINTDIDRIIYEDNVSFISENVTFQADKLVVIESTNEFYATGNPIKISFFDGFEFIEGEAAQAKIVNEDLILSESVSIVKSGNKIKSESLVIKLKR